MGILENVRRMATSLTPRLESKPLRLILAYALAIGLAFGALGLTSLFRGYLGESPLMVFIGAVALSAWFAGMGAGIATAVASLILVDYFLTVPLGVIQFGPHDFVRYSLFLVVTILISALEARRRESQIELQEARDQLHVIVNTITDGVSAQIENGEFIFANEAAAQFVGLADAETMVKEEVANIRRRIQVMDERRQPIPPHELPRVRAFATRKLVHQILLFKDTDTGSERWVNLSVAPVLDADGNATMVVNIFRDISERKDREAQLLSLASQLSYQKARLDNVIRNVPGIIWEAQTLVGGQRTDFVSPYVEKMLGYKPQQFEKVPDFWSEIVPKVDQDHAAKVLGDAHASKSRDAHVIEFRARAADGRLIDIESHISFVYDSNDNAVGAVGAMMDVSARKRQDKALREYANALQSSNRELEQFAYVASHDLQEPLRMVTSYLQLLEKRLDGELDDEGREYIGYAVDGASRMKKLITDLLTYSRVQRGELEAKPVDMAEVVKRVLNNLQVSIEESGAVVTHDPLPTVRGDEAQLTQLLQNLVSNAIKFREDKTPTVHIGAESRQDDWVFSVKDNGIGIDPQFANRVFIIFQRLHSGGRYSGTGIGLAICKKIVQRHGGEIWLDSQPGAGSTFFFSIPYQRTGPIFAATLPDGQERSSKP